MTKEVSCMAGCRTYRRRFSAYLDGELSIKKQRVLADHLATCSGCCRELAALERLGPALARLDVAPPPADLESRIVAAARRRREERASGSSVRLRPAAMPAWSWGMKAAGAAAMVVAMLYLGQFVSTRGWLPGSRGGRAAISTTEGSAAEGLEWFAPAPPGSLLSGYLAMAGQKLPADRTHH
ncbi:MAG: zf-HC2 domain-containing protein [Proteobacteria bacterium]|nr:zf-HC2 domain-containing protein [Pseudomonadota bacterium]